MDPQLDFLNSARVNGIMQGLQDPRLMPAPLIWNNRIPAVPAADDEIMARFIGNLLIADIVADDAKAVVYDTGKFQFETTKIPNLKMGIGMNQSMLNQLEKLRRGFGGAMDLGLFTNWENRNIVNVKYGVELRREVLNVAMLTDGLSYDRLGIKMSNVTWGMPSDLKVTSSTAWDDVAAVGLTEIQTMRRLARVRYGIEFNRLTMSTSGLQYLVRQTEFINQAKVWGFGMFNGVPSPAIPMQNDSMLRQIVERILGGTDTPVTIELDDRRYWTQDQTGYQYSSAIQPITKVIFTASSNDGNSMAYDFANGVTTESIVANLARGAVQGTMPVGFGPIAYQTLADQNMNPPGLVYWGVRRGFPRKHMLQSSAVLTVGTFTDTIATGVPFPL